MFIEFIPGEKYPRKNADESHEIGHFQDAGYMLNDSDLVVDIDNMEKGAIQKMLTTFNIGTQIVWTDRGCHLYFKKPDSFKGSERVCPLGFPVEYKHKKNTRAVAVKRGGIMRTVENKGVREDLPDCLFTRKKLESLLGLDNGDGRNNALFGHRMKIHHLQAWEQMARFINNHVFAEPLDDEEFQTIVRDEVKVDAAKDGEPEIADFIMKKYKVVMYMGFLYFYDNGEYITDDALLQRIIFNEVGNKKTFYVDEIIKQLAYRVKIIDPAQTFDIKLKNGILRNGHFINIDYQEFTPYYIDIAYNPDAKPVKEVDEYVNMMTKGDKSYEDLFFEILAHPLIVDKEIKRMLGKFFIFIGDGGNGKGTLLAIIREILKPKNCSGLSISNMSDERYFTTLQGKLVNLGDDIQDQPIDNDQMKQLKNISTCDFVATRQLFKQSREVELTTTLIFTSNHILKSFEKGASYKRRVVWLPMYTKPTTKKSDFITKLTTPEALEYWMTMIIDGYSRLYKNNSFTECEIVNEFNQEYHEENNSALQYLKEMDEDDFLGLKSPEAYEEYETWAEENGLNVQSKKLFVQSVYDMFSLELRLKRINKKPSRVFMRNDEIGRVK